MSKATYWQKGGKIDFTNATEKEIENGTIVAIGKKVGIAGMTIPKGETGSLVVEGVFKFPKTTEAITVGTDLYYDDATEKVTATAGENPKAGWAVDAAGTNDEFVLVKIG